jgi:hypothetical protein
MFFSNCSNTNEELQELTLEDKDMLIQMREEEKLARDVYDYLYIKYDLDIFDNISNSEQKHMDKVLYILEKYNIPDPALANPGEFSNSMLQDLYNQLIIQGDISETEALKVGATIEDVDIYDLIEFTSQTENQLIVNTFDKLNCGSRNHMRVFYSQLISQGVDYEPQFITTNELDIIINDSHEGCGH